MPTCRWADGQDRREAEDASKETATKIREKGERLGSLFWPTHGLFHDFSKLFHIHVRTFKSTYPYITMSSVHSCDFIYALFALVFVIGRSNK